MADNGAGGVEADTDFSGGLANPSSYNELDFPQTVQKQFSPSSAQEFTPQPSSIDTSVYNTLSNMPSAPPSGLANTSNGDFAVYDRQSLSRSMSRASSPSTDSIKITTMNDTNENTDDQTRELGGGKPMGDGAACPVENMSSLDANSDFNMNISSNAVPSDNIPIQNHVQDQNSSSPTPNGNLNTVPNLAAVIPDTGASSLPEQTAKPSETLPAPSAAEANHSSKGAPPTPAVATPRARLPHDKIGILEDRIKEDPRGDMEAWLNLIDEHKKRAKLEDTRNVYERFFSIFPSAAEEWLAYAKFENEFGQKHSMDKILQKALPSNPYLPLWSMYLDHIRRLNNLTTDTTGKARQIIHQAYDVALQRVGLDKDSGSLWLDYVNFIKAGPGTIGGSDWQDQQKMDLLRKVYQRAICIPHQFTNILWKEYDGFEMGLNKMTGRKFLQDQSPAYMSARSSFTELQNITRNLRRTTLPVLPPAPGFDGDVEYMAQLDIWKRWIQWERDDPLVLKQDDVASYRARILFVYKHALMAMRFWPELWCDASDFCFANDMESEGNEFLVQGIAANPESCLLAFKRADRIELSTAAGEGDHSALSRGTAVREPYSAVLDALYDLINKSKSREAQDIARIEANFATPNDLLPNSDKEDDDNEGNEDEDDTKEKEKAAQLESVKNMHAAQTSLLSKTLSYVWIALMRAMRRIQGKGKPNDAVAGLRGTFYEARKRGRIVSDVYVASALIEFHCYDVETGKKLFERGLKLFPEDGAFALEYIKHLVANNDHTNARVVFETAVTRLAQKPETVAKAKPLYAFFHEFESRYGELSQIMKLEKRMKDLYPKDPSLASFSQRFVEGGFDPTLIRPIVSPKTQTKPRLLPSIESHEPAAQTPPSRVYPTVPSPKRPLAFDDSDTEGGRPQKLVRTTRDVSPLKGAAGRRLDQQKRNNTRPTQETPQLNNIPMAIPPPPPPLPRDIMFLLGIIPKAESYNATKFSPSAIVQLIRNTHIPSHVSQIPSPQTARQQPPPQPPPQPMPMPTQIPQPPYQQHIPMQMSQMPQMQHPQYGGQYPGWYPQKFFPPFAAHLPSAALQSFSR